MKPGDLLFYSHPGCPAFDAVPGDWGIVVDVSDEYVEIFWALESKTLPFTPEDVRKWCKTEDRL